MSDDEAPEDLDLFMSWVNEDLTGRLSIEPGTKGRKNLDRIIAEQRKYRAQREQGIKPKKPRFEAPPSASLEQLLGSMPKPAPTGPAMKRRF